MQNIPEVKLGIIAVSRDCFPITLSEARRKAIKAAYKGEMYECPVTVENEKDMLKAVEDVNAAGCNALVVFLGNFGPETPETLIAKYFDGVNDGLVSEKSFPWGEKYIFLTTEGDRGISHGDMVDLNRENIKGFDVREFYVQLVHDLKVKGF